MRTTLSIDDELLDQAKRQALDLGLTVSEVVNRVLRRGLGAQKPVGRPYQTIVYGEAEAAPIDWGLATQRMDAEDVAWLRSKGAL